MAGNHTLAMRRKFGVDDVEVGPADAARTHPQQHLTGRGPRIGDLFQSNLPARIVRVSHGCQHTLQAPMPAER